MELPDPVALPNRQGLRLLHRVTGPAHAPWLVLTNGAVCSDDFWTAGFLPALQGRVRTLDWNYRGHYGSDPSPDPDGYRVEDHADDLCDLLDAHRIRRAAFLGFSLGVQVTLELFRRRPDAFAAAVLVSGSSEDPLRTFAGTPTLRPLLAGLLEFAARHPDLARLFLRHGMGGPLAPPLARWSRFCERDVPDAPFRRYLARAGRLDPLPVVRTLRLMAEHSARDLLPHLHRPVLLVAGPADTMTPLRVMQDLRSRLPDAEYHQVPHGAHTLLMTRGPDLAERVLDFLHRRAGLERPEPADRPPAGRPSPATD